MSWIEFEEQSPELASFGAARLNEKIAFPATIKRDGSPCVHPVRPFFCEDGRYALHYSVSGRNLSEFNQYLHFG
jgi:hypothetical protein